MVIDLSIHRLSEIIGIHILTLSHQESSFISNVGLSYIESTNAEANMG